MHFPVMEISNGGRIMVLAKEESSKDDGNKKSQETSRHVFVLYDDAPEGFASWRAFYRG